MSELFLYHEIPFFLVAQFLVMIIFVRCGTIFKRIYRYTRIYSFKLEFVHKYTVHMYSYIYAIHMPRSLSLPCVCHISKI